MDTMWQELGELTALPDPLVGGKGRWLPLPKNPSPLLATSDGRNQIAIRFNRDLNRNEDSIQTLRDSIQVPCDLLILIRFKF